ncbi:peptide deformylase [Candidatus Profftia sp. (ex Adelges kitamiensis)]|uniref:peptide deformylase n=1 Tax=Candidatus Profftia sp. (ex Adelges kitamiensis) TaxID=2864218 RepID=UPI001CE3ADFE|nr:peptide deformylase [Candidatus Profftia sp. (ex Adelges kitamiensis)]
MVLLQVLYYPDKRLRTKAQLVKKITPKIQLIIDNMLHTMYAEEGIGLAATQVDIHYRIIVIDISHQKDQHLILINPKLLTHNGIIRIKESCLSIPEYHVLIPRAARIRVRALDRNGKTFELDANDLLAICIQHEMDHLLGKLIIDYLSPLKRQLIHKKLQKIYKQQANS